MKQKTQERTVWAARTSGGSKRTFIFAEDPWPLMSSDGDELVAWMAVRSKILEATHDPFHTHYGLRPGQKKKLVVELTIREAE